MKTDACCCADSHPDYIKDILKEIDDEIISSFYGCGSPIPPAVEGCTILDMGCGTGRDVFICSKLAGENGRVIGIDMTEEQLETARRHIHAHGRKFGYSRTNVSFVNGFMEDLRTADIADSSIDIVISNCVINLSPEKEKVFSEIFRVLKPGGELYFSDVFVDRRLPAHFFG